jgi:hypothetical protein
MATVKELQNFLKDHDPDQVIAWDLWVADDALDWNDTLTQEEAESVIEKMHHGKDASIGFSWDVLDVYVDIVLADRDKS